MTEKFSQKKFCAAIAVLLAVFVGSVTIFVAFFIYNPIFSDSNLQKCLFVAEYLQENDICCRARAEGQNCLLLVPKRQYKDAVVLLDELLRQKTSFDDRIPRTKVQRKEEILLELDLENKTRMMLDRVYGSGTILVSVQAQLDFENARFRPKNSPSPEAGVMTLVDEFERVLPIERLSIWIVADNKVNEAQYSGLKEVIAASTGYDRSRGDVLKVVKNEFLFKTFKPIIKTFSKW